MSLLAVLSHIAHIVLPPHPFSYHSSSTELPCAICIVNSAADLQSDSPCLSALRSAGPRSSGPWVLGPRSGPRSSVRMTMLKLLALGAGLGSVWVSSWWEAETADVGCMINAADWTMTYRYAEKNFWLHVAYHGVCSDKTWQDRVLCAMRLALQTLLEGKDVAVHCAQGPLWKKIPGPRGIHMQGPRSLRHGTYPRSRVHEA